MEVQSKITSLNELNRRMAAADHIDDQEYSEIQSERREFSKRWSKLIQQVKEEYKRYIIDILRNHINAWLLKVIECQNDQHINSHIQYCI